VALALHDAGQVASVVKPAQIRDFARTKLGRNKIDKVDAALICESAELFKPQPRRHCQGRAERKNRLGSGLGDSTATSWPSRRSPLHHFTSQHEAIDRAIGETIDQNTELRGRRDSLLSSSASV
jgi:transposase